MCQHEEADRKDRARKDAAKSQEKVTGPAQEPDPLLSDFAKALEEHRESIPVAIMDHIDQLQRQIDFSRGGKFGPTDQAVSVKPRDITRLYDLAEYLEGMDPDSVSRDDAKALRRILSAVNNR